MEAVVRKHSEDQTATRQVHQGKAVASGRQADGEAVPRTSGILRELERELEGALSRAGRLPRRAAGAARDRHREVHAAVEVTEPGGCGSMVAMAVHWVSRMPVRRSTTRSPVRSWSAPRIPLRT